MEYCTWLDSPVGRLMLLGRDEALCGLWLEGQKHFAPGFSETRIFRDDTPIFRETARWLDAYFTGKQPQPQSLPLCPGGTAFQTAVWRLLLEIPYGSTTTYGDLARQMGTKGLQAVGGAVGRNPISLIIPCHRVMGATGSLTGYAGGVEKKQWLLRHEGVPVR